jgi:DNA invertase Pin-like site-specific DNA recombinase
MGMAHGQQEDFALTRAAGYVRMSTSSQALSPDLQEEFLRRYASLHAMNIVRIYLDEGRSGLVPSGRTGLRDLLADIATGSAGFSVLLIYDVSRWGRYQNVDESGFYEFICRRAGISVVYCAEPFVNDGTPLSQLMKSIKRSMAAEYSRELSTKVFAGQRHLAQLGYKQGGAATFGMKRVAVAANGTLLRELEPEERKPHPSDHVRLSVGDAGEVKTVRRIFDLYVRDGCTIRAIRRQLNAEGVRCQHKAWTDYLVSSVLSKPQYWGVQAYNRTSTRLKTARVRNPQEQWICVDQAFSAMVPPEDGLEASRIRKMRNGKDYAAVLEGIRHVYEAKGRVSYSLLARIPGMPGARRLRRMFGTLVDACTAAGIANAHLHVAGVSVNALKSKRDTLLDQVQELVRRAGGFAKGLPGANNQLLLNGQYCLRISVVGCRGGNGHHRWRVQVHGPRPADFILAGLLDENNEQIARYALISTASDHRKIIYFGSGRYAKSRKVLFPDLPSIFGLNEKGTHDARK